MSREGRGAGVESGAAVTALDAALDHYRAGRLDEAEALCRQIVEKEPRCGDAWDRLAHIAERRNKLEEAVACYERALPLVRQPEIAHCNLAVIHQRRGDRARASAHYREAQRLGLDHHVFHSNLAVLLKDEGRLEDAETLLQRALAAAPDHAEAHVNLGLVLCLQGRADEGIAHLRRAVELAPGAPAAEDALLLCLHYSDRDRPDALAAAHRRFGARHEPSPPPPLPADRDPARRLRVGILSPDLCRHSVAVFIEPLLEAGDRSSFEWIGYSDVRQPDDVTERLRSKADAWRAVAGLDDGKLYALLRQDRVDVLLELAGHTSGNRLAVLARRPAPVQVTWIGYPDTTGLSAVDLRITDRWADPDGEAATLASERLARLPGGFLCYRPPDLAPDVMPGPAGANGPVTFASFNSLAKVGATTLALWRAVLEAVPDARLLVKSSALGDPWTREGFVRRADAAGLPVSRLSIVGHVPGEAAHLASYGRADIALDTFPYHGTTTTCEALWMGVPVVTLAGPAHAARVGLSLLTQACLPELAAATPAAYVATAAALARDRPRLAALRETLRDRLRRSPLLDGQRLARELEAVLRQAWRERIAGSGPRGHGPPQRTTPASAPAPWLPLCSRGAPAIDVARLREGTASRRRRKILVEGWRFISHSYAVVNQWQLLALRRRGDVELSVRDLPFYRREWQPAPGLFASEEEAALATLPSPLEGEQADAVLRIAYPLDLRLASTPRTAVFGTAEFRVVEPSDLAGTPDLAALRRDRSFHVLTPSQWSAEGFRRLGLSPEQVAVVPHGVEVSRFRPMPGARAAGRRALGLEAFTFLSIGAMTPNKGIDLLLKAFAIATERHPEIRLVLKGADKLYGSIGLVRRYLDHLTMRERERVCSRLLYDGSERSMAQMSELYQVADAYVSPYRAEGFNMPVLEAAACGLPVICTAGGATDDFVSDAFARRIEARLAPLELEGRTGEVLVPDLDHLIHRMVSTIADEEWRLAAAVAGPAHVARDFTWDRVAERLVAVLVQEDATLLQSELGSGSRGVDHAP